MADASILAETRAAEKRSSRPPVLSVCIPQFNRTDFLLENLQSLARQSFRDFEICISDDCSNDGGEPRLVEALSASGLDFAYRRNPRNLRYDANLRSAIDLARGEFALLLGNDDCLADDASVSWLVGELRKIETLGVALTNYADHETGALGRRVLRQAVVSGPDAAARHFRDFSFVSGVVLRTELAQALQTERWDGSEMYQMYLACRIVASGSPLALFERVFVRKDIKLPGQTVDSYRLRPRESLRWFQPIRLPVLQVPSLVCDAIRPYAGSRRAESQLAWRVASQVQLFTFPFWLIEYRRVQPFNFALGLWRAMRPSSVFAGCSLGSRMVLAWVLYGLEALALLVPVSLFDRCRSRLHWLAKRSFLGSAR